jgi:hypothetical protein
MKRDRQLPSHSGGLRALPPLQETCMTGLDKRKSIRVVWYRLCFYNVLPNVFVRKQIHQKGEFIFLLSQKNVTPTL